MKLTCLIILAFILLSGSAICQTAVPVSTPDAQVKPQNEALDLIRRFQDPRHLNMLQSAMWTVGHDYADFKHMQEILESFGGYMDAIQKSAAGDSGPLDALGGMRSFKEKRGEWLKDGDQAIRAFAAIIIGISGDREKVPQLVGILKRKDSEDRFSRIYDKGRAAIALGLLGAVEYKPDILVLLKSKNRYDRTGAITALTLLGAKENAREVVAILADPDLRFEDDASPIYFLTETGTAKDFKKELSASMLTPFGTETSKAAMYTLVHLGAKEYAPQIAKLLNDEFKKGDAAKALALLGAKEYTTRIGLMLNDKNQLVQEDAALALGLLGAKKYAPKLAVLMENKKNLAHRHAAAAIILMNATAYSARASAILAGAQIETIYLGLNSFHPLVEEEVARLIEKVKAGGKGP
jgi:HEAT repeat protein